MSNFVWCHGPSCHKSHTQDRIRGVKGSKVLRTKKVQQHQWNSGQHFNMYSYFCSQGCANQWLNKNMACVEGRTVVPFTTHRKTSEQQYENKKIKARYGEHYYNEISRV